MLQVMAGFHRGPNPESLVVQVPQRWEITREGQCKAATFLTRLNADRVGFYKGPGNATFADSWITLAQENNRLYHSILIQTKKNKSKTTQPLHLKTITKEHKLCRLPESECHFHSFVLCGDGLLSALDRIQLNSDEYVIDTHIRQKWFFTLYHTPESFVATVEGKEGELAAKQGKKRSAQKAEVKSKKAQE